MTQPTTPPQADRTTDQAPQLVEIDPADWVPAPGNRPVTLDSVADLLESLPVCGQLVWAVGCPHPDLPGKVLGMDGSRRAKALQALGRKIKVVLVPAPLSPQELRRVRVTTSAIRKGLTPDELAAEIAAHIEETDCTQEAAAAFFTLKSAAVSKLLAPMRRLVPDLHGLLADKRISRDAVRVIATMPTPDLQHRLAEQALATAERNGRVKRETVIGLKKRLLGEAGGRRPKAVTVRCDGAAVTVPADWPWERVIDWLKARVEDARRLSAHKLPPSLFGRA